jgi:hypothetical protein
VPGLSQYWHPHSCTGGPGGCGRRDARSRWTARAPTRRRTGARAGMPAAGSGARPTASRARTRAWPSPAGGRARGAARPAAALVVRFGARRCASCGPPACSGDRAEDSSWHLRGRTARYEVAVEGEANGSVPHLLPVRVPRRAPAPRRRAAPAPRRPRSPSASAGAGGRSSPARRTWRGSSAVGAGLAPLRAARSGGHGQRLGADEALETRP